MLFIQILKYFFDLTYIKTCVSEMDCSSCLNNPHRFIKSNTSPLIPQPNLLCYFNNTFLGKFFIVHNKVDIFKYLNI